MTDSQQQDSFDMSEIMALAATKFGGTEFQNDKTETSEEEENSSADENNADSTGGNASSGAEANVEAAANENTVVADAKAESTTEAKQPDEVKPAEIDPLLKALLEQSQPKPDDVSKKEPENNTSTEPVEKAPENVQVPPQNNQPQATPAKAVQPNDLIDDATRKMLMEYRDLDEQSFNVIDQVAAAHARANSLNLENAMVQVVQNMQQQLAQQNQIIAQLQNQLAGVNTRMVAPTLDQDIEAMKADPLVAAYLPYMQNVLNGNDSNAKMQLVNTWKQSKSQATPSVAVTPAPVIERRTSNVSAAAEATAALANKTQSSMVQPTDEIKEGMDLAAARFGPNR